MRNTPDMAIKRFPPKRHLGELDAAARPPRVGEWAGRLPPGIRMGASFEHSREYRNKKDPLLNPIRLWGVSHLLPKLILVGWPLLLSNALATKAGADYAVDPCATENPPAWCADYEPPITVYPEGTLQPDVHGLNEAPPRQGPPLFLVGSTLVAPPPVLWLNGRPHDPSRVYGVGEAVAFVKALELILPAGWTIWTSEDLVTLNRTVGESVLWDGNGQPWPDVLEALAQQYGVEITADVLSRRAVVGLSARTQATDQPGQAARGARQLSPGLAGPQTRMRGGPAPTAARSAAQGSDHPLYRLYATPTKLSADPLPDTIGRVAWRFVPVGVQINLSALGAYINAPVFQWDFGGSLVSPKAALAALMPVGYCLDEGQFPTVKAAVCDEGVSVLPVQGFTRQENNDGAR